MLLSISRGRSKISHSPPSSPRSPRPSRAMHAHYLQQRASPRKPSVPPATCFHDVSGSVSAATLEAETGVDRYTLARGFRACFGTSPHRYLIGRRLDRVKAEIARGISLAGAAYAAGFADQSHMTRHFKSRFGLTPGGYAALCASEVAVPAPIPTEARQSAVSAIARSQRPTRIAWDHTP